MQTKSDQRTSEARSERTFGFGAGPRARRKMPSDGRSNQDLIAEFLAKKSITICPTRYADGAVKTSGSYDF